MAELTKIGNNDFFLTDGTPLHIDNVSCSDSSCIGYVTINTAKIDNNLALDVAVAHIHVSEKAPNDFDITLDVNEVPNTISYKMNVIDGVKSDYTKTESLNNDNTSFELLRVNPKLTGNVKVVVDSSSNMYMDTFKVSRALSQSKYGRIAINPDEYYGRTLMSVFDGMSSEDFYKTEDGCHDIFTKAVSYDDQYYDKYNSGVRTNFDHRYSENFSMLAPLCIKDIMPDFFLIFKVTKDDIAGVSDEQSRIKRFFEKGKLVKSFDLRDGTNLGKYIRNVHEKAEKYPGYVYIAYMHDGYNKYNGISIDRGCMTEQYESVFDAVKNIKNQVGMNDWYTLGFKRNRIVAKDIVNFEYMFDDPGASIFSLNTYFGVYVKMNSNGDPFVCIGKNKKDGTYEFYNDDVPSDFDPTDEKYRQAIYGYSDNDKFNRLTDSTFAKCKNLSEYLYRDESPRPYKNIEYTHSYGKVDASSYIAVSLDEPVDVGEHYRIIDRDRREIYEVIISNYDKYKDKEFSEPELNEYDYCGTIYKIHRISILNKQYREEFESDDDKQAEISKDIDRLCDAFLSICGDVFTLSHKSDDSFSVLGYSDNIYFEKFCSAAGFDLDQRAMLETYDERNMRVFGDIYPSRLFLDINKMTSDNNEYNEYIDFYPMNFAALGNRVAYCVKFKELARTIDGDNSLETIEHIDPIIYYGGDCEYHILEKTKCEIIAGEPGEAVAPIQPESMSLMSYTLNSSIIDMPNPPTSSERINLFSANKLTPGICSVLPVKDFYYDVLDDRTKITYTHKKRTDSVNVVGEGGEYTKDDNCYGLAALDRCEESFFHYLYKDTYNYFDSSNNDNNLLDFFTSQMSGSKGDISLIAPYSCKWKFIGTDATGNSMRLMYNLQSSISSSKEYGYIDGSMTSYFIVPDDSSTLAAFFGEGTDASMGVVDEKMKKNVGFISSGDTSIDSRKTTSYMLSDVVASSDEDHQSARDYILKGNGKVDDILYSSSNTANKYSTCYAQGDDTLMFVSSGIIFKLTSENTGILNLGDYNGYLGTFVTDTNAPKEYPNPIELIIDETDRKILLVWHTASDGLGTGLNGTDAESHKGRDVVRVPHKASISDEVISYVRSADGNLRTNVSDTSLIISPETKNVIIESESMSDTAFTDDSNVMIVSSIEYSEEDGPIKNGYLYSGIDSSVDKLYHDGSINSISTASIKAVSDSYYGNVAMFLVGGLSMNESDITKLSQALKSVSIYIKTSNGVKDYSNIEELLKISRMDPYAHVETTINDAYRTHGFVVPTYAEPALKDILSFEYSDSNLNDKFRMNLNGGNIMVSDIARLGQLWIKKMIPVVPFKNVLVGTPTNRAMCIDVLHNISLTSSIWDANIFSDYDSITDERTVVNAFDCGYEKNTFFGSRGLCLKRNGIETEIELTHWVNTVFKDNYIRLNITDTLSSMIMASYGFINNWSTINAANTTKYKSKYIEKSILGRINITNDTTFSLYKLSISNNNSITDYEEGFERYKVDNIKNELKYSGGKYYMYIYPNSEGRYSAKLKIRL